MLETTTTTEGGGVTPPQTSDFDLCIHYNGKAHRESTALYTLTIDLLFDRCALTASRFIEIFGESFLPRSMEEQLQVMNDFWRDQLGAIGPSTIAVRSHLVSNCSAVDWARHFEKYIVPEIVKLSLPKRPLPPAIIDLANMVVDGVLGDETV